MISIVRESHKCAGCVEKNEWQRWRDTRNVRQFLPAHNIPAFPATCAECKVGGGAELHHVAAVIPARVELKVTVTN